MRMQGLPLKARTKSKFMSEYSFTADEGATSTGQMMEREVDRTVDRTEDHK